MREALAVIAEVRDSDRLKLFLESGQDRKGITAPLQPFCSLMLERSS